MGQIDGLPAHVLVVHLVVVAVPLSALLLVASAAWPAARRRLGLTTGSIVQVYRIGESGARASWHSTVLQNPTGGGD